MKKEMLHINLLAIAACFLWSTAFAGIRIGLPYTTPIQFAGIRFIVAGILVFLFIKQKKQLISVFKQHFLFILKVGFFHTFLQYLFFYLGMDRVDGAIGAIVIGAGPLFISIMAHFMLPDDKIAWKKFLGIITGFSGVIIVALSKNASPSENGILYLGIVFLLICNLNSGYTNIFIAKSNKKISPITLTSISMFMGGSMLFIVSLFIEPFSFAGKPPEYYLSLVWLSILSAVALSIWIYLLQKPNVVVSDLNLWKFIIPVSGAALAWILIPGESPNIASIAGMIITAIGLLWVNYLNRNKKKVNNK